MLSDVSSFAKLGHRFRYPREAVLFVQRDQASKLFLILDGIVKLSIFSDRGEERILEFIKPTRFLGAPDVFSGTLYGITAIAYTDVLTVSFTSEQVRELVGKNADFTTCLAYSLSRHARALGRQLVGDTFFPATGRVGFALLNLAVQIGTPTDDDGVALPITHNELAKYVGCNRITVTKAISELAADGLVKGRSKQLHIPDLSALRRRLDEICRV